MATNRNRPRSEERRVLLRLLRESFVVLQENTEAIARATAVMERLEKKTRS